MAATLLPQVSAAVSSSVRGRVAFHYDAAFSKREREWYTRFDALVTGAILDGALSDALRARGTRMVAYEWSSGYYPGDTSSALMDWQRTVERNKRAWLLSENVMSGAAADSGKGAFWYDFGADEVRQTRADYLALRLRTSNYDGFFFDTLGFSQLPKPMQEAYRQRHPGRDYEKDQGLFLQALRERIGVNKIIFTNQGFRNADAYLPCSDYDLSESYLTASLGNGTLFRAWSDPAKPWESIQTIFDKLVLTAAAKYPKVKFVHANYAHGDAATYSRAARYGWAVSKMFGHEAYLINWGNSALEENEIYFQDTGAALEPMVEEGRVIWRRFEKGVAAVNPSRKPAAIPSLSIVLPEGQQGYWFADPA